MEASADVIVIGAGAGGLIAAATLARAGRSVLVLEKNPHIGGTAYVYGRGGFSFPMGPLGFSSPEFVAETIRELAAPPPPTFVRADYRLRAFGLDLSLSRRFESLVSRLSAVSPGDAGPLRKGFEELRNIAAALRFPEGSGAREAAAEAARVPAADWCTQFSDWRLRRVVGSIGTHPPYSSLLLLAAMWDIMAERGIWRPAGGMPALWQSLEETIRRDGQILLSSEVAEVLISRGRGAQGVRTVDGRCYAAESIISNADFKTTFLGLVPADAVPAPWRRTIERASQTESVFQVSLGLDTNRVDLSLFEGATNLVHKRSSAGDAGSSGLDWTQEEIEPEALAAQELEICLWEGARAGPASVVLRTLVDFEHFSRFRPAPRQRLAGYREYKDRLADGLVAEAETLLPGLRSAALVRDVATPLTFADQGGRFNGAVAGWSWDFGEEVARVPDDLVRTPVKGLYMAGYQAATGLYFGGVPTAVMSGRKAAEAVLRGS